MLDFNLGQDVELFGLDNTICCIDSSPSTLQQMESKCEIRTLLKFKRPAVWSIFISIEVRFEVPE